MATVIENIAEAIVARLEEIRVENGYSYSVSEVHRPTRRPEGIAPRHLGILVTQGDSTRARENDLPGNPPAVAYTVTFSIAGFVRMSDKESDIYDTTVNEFMGDIQVALTDVDQWYTFGGNAIFADLGDVTKFSVNEGDHQGATLEVIVTYRVSENDPSEVR